LTDPLLLLSKKLTKPLLKSANHALLGLFIAKCNSHNSSRHCRSECK
jgi:hypothetical protein